MLHEDNLKVPYVHEDVVDYLDVLFSRDSLLSSRKVLGMKADEALGYMLGIQEVINSLRLMCDEQKGE